MGRSILVISRDEDQVLLARMLLRQEGCDVTCACLDTDHATASFPHIDTVIQQQTASGSLPDAILLYDSSRPDNSYVQVPLDALKTASDALETLRSDMEQMRPSITAEGHDPVALSVRQEMLQRDLDAMFEDEYEERRHQLTRSRNAAESILLRNPPSAKGIELVRKLRTKNSPYAQLPIAVAGLFPGRESEMVEAGANVVHTSADNMCITPCDLVNAALKSSSPDRQSQHTRWSSMDFGNRRAGGFFDR